MSPDNYDFSASQVMFITVVIGTLLFLALAVAIIFFIRLHHKTRQKFEWERQQHQQALLQTEIEIREQTLAHISRELHDNLGQIASLIKINLNLVSPEVKGKDRNKIDESIELLKRMIGDIRSLSLSLNSESIDRAGLFQALMADVERINRMGQLEVALQSKGVMPGLRPDESIFLYRMCQEIFNNVLKHADASHAGLLLECKPGVLSIAISDNGKGFDPAAVMQAGGQSNGSGMGNLHKRCRLIGADLKIDSAPGKGARICITLPLT